VTTNSYDPCVNCWRGNAAVLIGTDRRKTLLPG
jgi:hypothetical protein